MLHACAQNPTGIDPTQEQWKELSELLKSKKHLPLFDMVRLRRHCSETSMLKAVRHTRALPRATLSETPLPFDTLLSRATRSCSANRSPRCVLSLEEQTLADEAETNRGQNLGLYGERAGTFSMVTSSPEEKERVLSQVKRVIRPLYSSPPLHGAQLVATILGTPELYEQWYVPASVLTQEFELTSDRLGEVKKMADRIISMRDQLYNKLIELKTPGEWGHIKSQIGTSPLIQTLLARVLTLWTQACSRSPEVSLARKHAV